MGLRAVFLAGAQATVSLFDISRFLLPSVVEIARAYSEYVGLLGAGLAVTGFEVLVSFAASAAVGMALGVVTVKSRLVGRAVFPLLVIGQSVPSLRRRRCLSSGSALGSHRRS